MPSGQTDGRTDIQPDEQREKPIVPSSVNTCRGLKKRRVSFNSSES